MHRRQRTRRPHGHARRAEQRKRTTSVSGEMDIPTLLKCGRGDQESVPASKVRISCVLGLRSEHSEAKRGLLAPVQKGSNPLLALLRRLKLFFADGFRLWKPIRFNHEPQI